MDKKPFKIPSISDFQWSPTDNRLVYWTAEDGNVPARLVLAEVNGTKLDEVRSKVGDCLRRAVFSSEQLRHYSMSSIANYHGKNVAIIWLSKSIDIRRRVEIKTIRNIR